MKDNQRILALIPARGGSKGLPRKNIKELNGKPLIAYSIASAMESKYILKEDIICSTDSEEIAEIARKFGAQVPFIRPKELAADESTTMSVILHAMDWIEKNIDRKYGYLIFLSPTSPLRTGKHIDEAIKILFEKKGSGLVSVTRASESPYWMKIKTGEGKLLHFIGESDKYNRRQACPDVYVLNGAIYIAKWKVLKEDKSFEKRDCYGFIMDRESSADVDSLMDFKIAGLILKEKEYE